MASVTNLSLALEGKYYMTFSYDVHVLEAVQLTVGGMPPSNPSRHVKAGQSPSGTVSQLVKSIKGKGATFMLAKYKVRRPIIAYTFAGFRDGERIAIFARCTQREINPTEEYILTCHRDTIWAPAGCCTKK